MEDYKTISEKTLIENSESVFKDQELRELKDLKSTTNFKGRSTHISDFALESKNLTKSVLDEGNLLISNWEPLESFKARLLDCNDEYVSLELLIDLDKGITEERAFETSLFQGYDINEIKFFKVETFKKKNEQKLKITPIQKKTECRVSVNRF